MNSRRSAPILFAGLCLGLSGLVLHRQIAAHPATRLAEWPAERAAEPAGPRDARTPTGSYIGSYREAGPPGWPVASEPARREALTTVTAQLGAIRSGDAKQAWFYQSRGLQRNFRSAEQFEGMIQREYPEFGHYHSVTFSPVWTDKTGNLAATIVTVLGENGRPARGWYQLIREDGAYKIAGVRGGHAIN